MAHDTAIPADVYFSADIVKVERHDDGTCTVYGICSSDSLDLDGQRADPTWLKSALSEWFSNWGNIREMHQPSAVGAATKLEWRSDDPWLTSVVIDPLAVAKCTSEPPVYKAYSIGVKNPTLRYDQRAPKGWIVGGTIVETSLVDRPSNPDTRFELVKSVSADEVLDMQTGTVWKRVDPNVGGGVDRAKLDASDFVFPDERDFPVVEPGDVSDAVSSWGRYKGEHSFADFKSRLTALAHRKGGRFVAELPESWTEEDKVANPTDEKTVAADADKSVDAAIEKDADVKAADCEDEKDAADGDGDVEMAAKTAELEKAASESAYCADCQKVTKIAGGEVRKIGSGHNVLVGTCEEGHALSKYLGADEEKSADADEAKDADADSGKDANAEDVLEQIDVLADNALGEDGDEDDDEAKAATAEKAAAVLANGDLLKAALLDVLAEAGIVDLEKVGKRMAENRLARFNAKVDELKGLMEKAAEANAGGPHLVSNDEGLQTQLVSCMREVQELVGQLAAGDGRFGLDSGRQDDMDDHGKADQISLAERMNFNKHAEADTAKAASTTTDVSVIAAELAKSVAAQMEEPLKVLARRLEEVEHTTRPATPVLTVAEREHAFSEKAANAREIGMQNLNDAISQMSQAEREQLLAQVVAGDRGWK